jgi:hypothetical protein
MELSMRARRTTFALGAATGGLLAATFLPMAVAVADTFDFGPTPGSDVFVETVTGFPPLDQEVSGFQQFDVNDTTTNTVVGHFQADETTTTAQAFSNQEFLVAAETAPAGDGPANGSVFDTAVFGGGPAHGGFENVYSDVVTGTGPLTDKVTDELLTPFGNFDLTPLVGGFHAALDPTLIFPISNM